MDQHYGAIPLRRCVPALPCAWVAVLSEGDGFGGRGSEGRRVGGVGATPTTYY